MASAVRVILLALALAVAVYRITPSAPPDFWEIAVLLIVALGIEAGVRSVAKWRRAKKGGA